MSVPSEKRAGVAEILTYIPFFEEIEEDKISKIVTDGSKGWHADRCTAEKLPALTVLPGRFSDRLPGFHEDA